MTLSAQSLTKRYGTASGHEAVRDEGKLLLDGTDVWTLSEAELATFRSRRIGFIFQFPSLLSNLTAVDNVAVPALLGRTMDAGQAYARASDLLARVGLRERAGAYPGSMSGGEQRRVAIARALINSPPLLLADEPTSDLDEDTETDIIDLLERGALSHIAMNGVSPSTSSRASISSSSPTTWNWPSARGELTKCARAYSRPLTCRR